MQYVHWFFVEDFLIRCAILVVFMIMLSLSSERIFNPMRSTGDNIYLVAFKMFKMLIICVMRNRCCIGYVPAQYRVNNNNLANNNSQGLYIII